MLFPPDGYKWFVRKNLPGTQTLFAPNWKQVCIAELRGWLRAIGDPNGGGGNAKDPDWLYVLEVDVAWLDSLGISLEAFFLPGDIVENQRYISAAVNGEVTQRSSGRAIWGEPLLKIELDGWQRTDLERGQPAKPSTWTFTNECVISKTNVTAIWPYDPRHPDPNPSGPALTVGQYVQVIGSLCTDEPHMLDGQTETEYLLTFGYAAAVSMYGQVHADEIQVRAVKRLWSGAMGEYDELNPARYNEIHPPDYFGILPPKDRGEVVRALAITAKAGFTSGDTEELYAEVQALPRPSRWHLVSAAKHISAATVASNVKVDEMTVTATGIKVHVRTQGSAPYGLNGNYFAMYRIGWRGVAPRLNAAVSTNGTHRITATDGDGKTVVRDASSAWLQIQQGVQFPGGAVAVTSRNAGYYDAFVVGNDHLVHTAATSGAAWAGWWTLPTLNGVPGSPITAISRSKDHLDVFVADGSGRIMTGSWEPSFTGWHAWSQINNGVTAPGGAVTAVSRRTDFLDLFTVGTDGHVYTAAWSPSATGWGGWWQISGVTVPPGSPITCVSRSTDKIDLFVSDAQGRLMTTSWSPAAAAWAPWSQVLGGMTAPGAQVAAVSRRADFLDVFHIGNDGKVYTGAWSPSPGTWGGWWAIPGIVCNASTPIIAFSPQLDQLVVVTSSREGNVMSATWAPSMSAWSPWSLIN